VENGASSGVLRETVIILTARETMDARRRVRETFMGTNTAAMHPPTRRLGFSRCTVMHI
jgi:hypothetical protein